MRLLRLLPRFRQAYRELEVFAAREQWSRNDLEAFQLERLNTVWAHAIEHVPFYRRLCLDKRIPARFDSLAQFQAQVPPLQKRSVQTDRYDLLSERAKPGVWRVTGGSTGVPTSVYRSQKSHLEMLRSRYRFHAVWNIDILDRMAYLWGHAIKHPAGFKGLVSRSKEPLQDLLRSRLRLSAYRMDRDSLRTYLDRIAAFRPMGIYSYSTSGYLLALEAKEMKFQCDSLKFVNLTSEPVLPHIVQTCEQAFGVPTVSEYGSVECGFLAGEWPDRKMRVREDLVFLETSPRADGRYDILVSVLNSRSFPLLRYQIGDVTDHPLEKPAQGLAILKNVAGRSSDALVSRSGRYYHSIAVEVIIELCEGVRRYQVHQYKDGSVSLRLESDYACPTQIAAVRSRLQQLLEGYPVEVTVVDKVPQTMAGKHRFIVSDLTPGSSLTHTPVDAGSELVSF